jgi:hypothetical protein
MARRRYASSKSHPTHLTCMSKTLVCTKIQIWRTRKQLRAIWISYKKRTKNQPVLMKLCHRVKITQTKMFIATTRSWCLQLRSQKESNAKSLSGVTTKQKRLHLTSVKSSNYQLKLVKYSLCKFSKIWMTFSLKKIKKHHKDPPLVQV